MNEYKTYINNTMVFFVDKKKGEEKDDNRTEYECTRSKL